MDIIVVFPVNNPFVTVKAKPVVSAAIPYIKYSKFKEDITIISPQTYGEQAGYEVINITYKNKISYYQNVIESIANLNPKVVEVHQDIKLASLIAKKFPASHITLVKHGEYLINRWREKFFITRFIYQKLYLKNISSVFCISNYVKETLQSLYPDMKNKFLLCYNNYGHIEAYLNNNALNSKQNSIIYTGKMQASKGINEFINALSKILIKYPNYQGVVIAGIFSKKNKYNKIYQNTLDQDVIKKLISEKRLIFLQNLSSQEVFTQMCKAKIAVIPTKKPEPFGLVALESHLAKCAVISSGKGGLKEISGDCALYLEEVSSVEIFNKMEKLITSITLRQTLATQGYEYASNKFNPAKLVEIIDNFREHIN